MASTYSPQLRLELIATGEQSGTWGVTTNSNLGTLIEQAIAGVASVSMGSDANYTLTALDGASDESRCMILSITSVGSLTATRDIICPDATKLYFVRNATTGGQSIRIKTSAGTGITIPNGTTSVVYCDATNVLNAVTWLSSLSLTTALTTANGGTGLSSAGTAGNVLMSNGSVWASTALIPSGTRMLFQQTSAPSGWTKETNATYNDAALRFQTSTVTTGGADGFSSVFGSSVNTGSHTLTTTEIPAHSHGVTDPGHIHAVTPSNNIVFRPSGSVGGTEVSSSTTANLTVNSATTGITIDNAGGGTGHVHPMDNFDLKYVDCIIAAKD